MDRRRIDMKTYPEHDKLAKVKDRSQAIGEFLDTGGYELGEWTGGNRYCDDEFTPVRKPINTILARYFGIDEDKLEEEKLQMLEELRKQ
jgi:hypothetical protein